MTPQKFYLVSCISILKCAYVLLLKNDASIDATNFSLYYCDLHVWVCLYALKSTLPAKAVLHSFCLPNIDVARIFPLHLRGTCLCTECVLYNKTAATRCVMKLFVVVKYHDPWLWWIRWIYDGHYIIVFLSYFLSTLYNTMNKMMHFCYRLYSLMS